MQRRVQYRKSAEEAYSELLRAFKQIGRVDSSSQSTMTVKGHAKDTPVRVSILESAGGNCLLEIDATFDTDDPEGPEIAQGAIDLLLKALDDPTYKTKAPSGCAGVVLLLGLLSGVAWYLFA
jgi:hypothetical protein